MYGPAVDRERVESPESPKLPAGPSATVAPVLAHGSILALQRSAGNAAVSRMLARAPTKIVPLTGAKLNHPRVSVPVEAGLSVTASPEPTNASGVTFGVEKLTVDPSDTTVDASTGAVTIGDAQPGGDLKVTAESSSAKAGAALRAIEKPTSLDSTTQTAKGAGASYGGEFKHTFKGKGKPAGLADGRIDEKFDESSPKNPFGTFTLKANKAGAPGWGLDNSGTMMSEDNVTIEKKLIDVRPFIKSASNPTPKETLPVGFSMTQHLHVKSKPSEKLDAAEFANTAHVRRLEERAGKLVVVVKAGKGEVVQDYTGPPAYRNAKASATSVAASPPQPVAPKGGKAPEWTRNEFTVTGDVVPSGGKKVFSITQAGKARLGCEIDAASGVVKVGSEPGTITVRVSDGTKAHFDEVSVTITAAPAAAAPPAGPGKGASLDGAAPEDESADLGEPALAQTGVLLAGLGEGRLLARQRAPSEVPPSEHQDVVILVKAKAWDSAVAALSWYGDDAAVQALARLTHDELMALAGAAARDARAARLVAEGERRRVELLRKAWADAVDKDWEAAAEVLNAFSDPDIADLIKLFSPDQLKALEAGAVKRMRGYDQRIVTHVRKRLGAKPGEVYGKVVKGRYFAKPRIPGVTPVWQAWCELRFEPDPAVAKATKIGFMQTVRMVDLPSGKPNDPIDGHAGRATPSGTTVDRPGGSKSAVYAQKNDGSLDGKNKFGSSPEPYSPAEFVDKPDWDRGPMRWDYELVVVALEGPDAGVTYARIEWGFTVEDQDGTLMPVMHEQRIEDKPSKEFHAAAAGWNRQAGGPAGAPGQQQAPALR